jgi:hypothetical protein
MPHVPDTVSGKRVTGAGRVGKAARPAVKHPRWQPYAGKPHVRFYAGGPSNGRPYRDRCDASSGWCVKRATGCGMGARLS